MAHVSAYRIPGHGYIPNSSIQGHPVLHYRSYFKKSTTAHAIEQHLSNVGVVTPQWRYTMYSTSHFHSTTHEVLCISHGKARLLFGGDTNPENVEITVEKGDVIIIPAGVSHRLLEDVLGDFQMVGSYLTGCSWDMCYGKREEEAKVKGIKDVKWFERDPIYGDDGYVLQR